jgi:F-type H+-transporting ATPase subunit alpha
LKNVPVNKVKDFERFLRILKHRPTLDALKAGKLTDEITDVIQTVAKKFQQNITKNSPKCKVKS